MLYAGLLIFDVRKLVQQYKRAEALDYPLLFIAIIAGLQMVGIILKFIHFQIYSETGEEYELLDIASRIWYLCADILTCSLLLIMSKGWGIAKVSLYDDYEIEFVMGLLLMTLRYVWVILGFFVESGSDDLYNIYDGYTGKCELINTVFFFAWFAVSINSVEIFKAFKYQKLKNILLTYGTLLLLVKPVLILLIYMFDEEHQHLLSNLVSFLAHFVVLSLMAASFTKKKGEYMKAALSNSVELGELRKGN